VADTVKTPLEQKINGVAGMIYMSSVSADDGSATITISFDVGYPLAIAAVDVQNRVSQAAAQLPAIVNQAGVLVQKKKPSITVAVNLFSPDNSVDLVTLSNYAYLQLLDPLKRLPGVADVTIFGERRYSMRVWLDPDKLAQMGITAVDVQNAVAEQNVQVAAGKIGQAPAPPGTEFEFQVNALGRLKDPQQFGDIVVDTDVHRGTGPPNWARDKIGRSLPILPQILAETVVPSSGIEPLKWRQHAALQRALSGQRIVSGGGWRSRSDSNTRH
jgi:HAE1 family hydrophobic/amphiphilic exporter-1